MRGGGGAWAATAVVALTVVALGARAAGGCPVILDVRTKQEWDDGHLPCAHRLPVQDDPELGAAIACLAGGKAGSTVKIYCRSGNRAGVARQVLLDQGFTKVTNEGGYENIKNSGLCDCTPQNTCDESAPSPSHGAASNPTSNSTAPKDALSPTPSPIQDGSAHHSFVLFPLASTLILALLLANFSVD